MVCINPIPRLLSSESALELHPTASVTLARELSPSIPPSHARQFRFNPLPNINSPQSHTEFHVTVVDRGDAFKCLLYQKKTPEDLTSAAVINSRGLLGLSEGVRGCCLSGLAQMNDLACLDEGTIHILEKGGELAGPG